MNNLTTRKIVLGILMTLVLAFSVQGIADALTFRDTKSGDYQVVQIGQPFTITFSITPGSNTTQITNATGQLVSDDGSTRINRYGYEVFDDTTNNRVYRDSAAANTLATTATLVTLTNNSRPGLSTEDNQAVTASGTLYVVDGSGAGATNIVTATGEAVYRRLGAGTAQSRYSYPRATATPDAKRSDAERYHYNEEAVGINVSPTTLTLTKSGTSIPSTITATLTANPTDTTASLYEGAQHSNRRLGSSNTLTGIATDEGRYTITITDITEDSDRPSDAPARGSITFTIFVLQNVSDSLSSTIGTGLSDGIAQQYGTVNLSVTLAGANSDFARVEFEVFRGPGRLYEDKDGDGRADKSASNRLTTFTSNGGHTGVDAGASRADVIFQPNRGTSHIRAWVYGNAPGTDTKSTEATYVFGFSQLQKVSGASPEQTGPPSSQLEDPFVARLVDSTGTTGIPGATITLTVAGTNASVVKDPNFPDDLYHDAFPATLEIETDTNGRVSFFMVLGDDPTEDQTVTAAYGTGLSAVFEASIRGTATGRTPQHIAILPATDGQSADEFGVLQEPLTVIVRDQYGDLLPDTIVEFETRDGGTLSYPDNARGEPGDIPGGTRDTEDYRRDIETNSSGRASVRYTAPPDSKRRTVTATLEQGSRTSVTFTINGTGTTGRDEEPEPEEEPGTGTGAGSSVSPLSITGAPSSIHTLTINAGATNTDVAIGNPDFTIGGGSVSNNSFNTGTSTSAVSTITLPSTTGTYTLTVRVGNVRHTVSITVTTATTPGTTTETGTLSLDVPRSGAPGAQLTVEVTATMANGTDPGAGVDVTLSTDGGIGTLSSSTVRTNPSGVATATLTLGTAGSTGFVTATATNYRTQQLRVTVSGTAPTPTPGTPTPPRTTPSGLRLVEFDGNNQTGEPNTWLADPLVVTVVNSSGQAVPNQVVQFSVTRGGGRVSPASPTTNASGQAQARLRLGRNAGTNTVTATINGVSVTFTATAELAPAYLEVYDGNNQRGTLNNELADPLVVQVLDDAENGVAGVSVRFQVTSRNARLTQRGTGYALRVDTDRNGMAEAPLTPTGAGTITVQATASGLDPVTFTITTGPPPANLNIVSGDNQAGNPGSALSNPLVVQVQDAEGGAVDGVTVTFEVTAGGGTLSAETATTNAQGRAQTSLTLGDEREVNSVQASVTGLDAVTFNTSIDAKILVSAANRPVMYWIDGGVLYHLAGAKASRVAARANDVAVDIAGGKIYWTAQTDTHAGTINRANLDGTNPQVLRSLRSVPRGIAYDSANDKLYLANSQNRIQRINVDGTGFEYNFIPNVSSPMSIAVASGRVYWTEADGNVRLANVTTRNVRALATGTGALGGIAAGSNKVYWTEQGTNGGSVRSVNHDGSGAEDAFTMRATPYAITVDTAAGKVYWSDGAGNIRRRNVDGTGYEEIVSGLMMATAIAVDGANVASDTPPTEQPTTARSKYDVNGDGAVDNIDVGIVAAALFSGSPPTSPGRLDVDGDGALTIQDLVAVSQNLDDSGTAAAPALLAKLSAVQVDRIQEQIDLLLGMNDRSPGALYALQYLQSLLASARPGKTQLLANYPNPFNPETWIPYELAADTNVKLTIYDAQGLVVRTLELGHQSAGYYTSRDRAAYWDGRNSFGELVASGLYFYQLETDETSSMRKMVILK